MSEVSTTLRNFDTDPTCQEVEIPVQYKNEKYILIPADGETGEKFNNARTAAARFEGDKLKQVEGLGSLEPILVAGCLCHTTEKDGVLQVRRDTGGRPIKVNIAKVRTFPYPMLKSLYDDAKRISHLGDDDKKDGVKKEDSPEGKPPGDSTAGSESPAS